METVAHSCEFSLKLRQNQMPNDLFYGDGMCGIWESCASSVSVVTAH